MIATPSEEAATDLPDPDNQLGLEDAVLHVAHLAMFGDDHEKHSIHGPTLCTKRLRALFLSSHFCWGKPFQSWHQPKEPSLNDGLEELLQSHGSDPSMLAATFLNTKKPVQQR